MSEGFIVSARKYRPTHFSDLLGQDAISATLKRAICLHKIAHAYLFCGPRGVGKTSAARIFAKSINCTASTAQGEACGVCESCRSFDEQRSFNIYELDAASNNSTEDIRRLINEVSVPPQIGRYKVYIIDEVHMLSQGAFNAFLKTLEEPPSYVVFILATTEKHKILPTILSRCQVFDFKPIPSEVIVGQLTRIGEEESIPTEPKALELIAKKADGGMRDALSLFDRIASFGNGRITTEQTLESLHILNETNLFTLTKYIKENNTSGILLLLDDLIRNGFDPKTILVSLQSFYRKLLLAYDNTTLPLAELSAEDAALYNSLSQELSKNFLFKAIFTLTEAEKNYRVSSSKRLLLEMAILGLTALGTSPAAESAPPQQTRSSATTTANSASSASATATAPRTGVSLSNRQPVNQQPSARPAPSPTTPPVRETGGTSSRRNIARPSLSSISIKQELSQTSSPGGGNPAPASTPSPSAAAPGASISQPPITASPLTDAILQDAWSNYISARIPQAQTMLRNSFTHRRPQLKSNSEASVVPLSQAEKQHFEQRREDIEKFIISELHLPSFHLIVEEPDERNKPQFMNNSEWLQEQIKNSPALRNLISGLDLEVQ